MTHLWSKLLPVGGGHWVVGQISSKGQFYLQSWTPEKSPSLKGQEVQGWDTEGGVGKSREVELPGA